MEKNNNSSMATMVETFFIEETINLIHDNEALTKWSTKIDELGLFGQKEIVTEEKSPVPFLWMNSVLVSTFEVLCPTKVEIEKYSKTPIPVELLEIVSLCKNEQYFDELQVWYNEKEKDPAIIGLIYLKNESSDWYRKHAANKYLIGRWADVKESLDSLINRAKKIFFKSETLRIKREILSYQRKLEDLEGTIEETFGNGMPETSLPF